MLHVIGELVELVAYGEVADEQIIADRLLRYFEPEVHKLVVVYRVNDLFLSVFHFIPEPCVLVGILTEMSGSMEEISYIVMGIGVNVKTKQEELPEEIKQIATSLLMEGVDIERTEAFKIILEELEHQYYDVLDSGFEDTLNEWRKLSVTLNQEIEVRAPGNTYEGVATDIDDDGNLLVKTTNGEVKRIVAGDVSIRPRK